MNTTSRMFREMTVLDMEITTTGLAALIRGNMANTLIVDTRGFTEYNTSHIKYSVNAFFSKLIRRRLFENKIDDGCLVSHLMGAAGERDMDTVLNVVLYAEEDKPIRGPKRRIASCNAPEVSTKILRVLRDRLEETNRFGDIMILEGGFNKFQNAYPQLCEPSEGMARALPQSLSQPCLTQQGPEGITMVLDFMYLGSQADSLDHNKLKALQISSVINLSMGCPKSTCITDEKNFMRIPVNDSYYDKLLPHFEQAFHFLEQVRQSGRKCLIHCLAGISRSPTLAISYIMRHLKMGSDEAYRFVKEKRPSISPNFNFMGQLLEYENHLLREKVLRPEQVNKQRSIIGAEKPPLLIQDCVGELGEHLHPPKVPKSASSHCVFTPQPSTDAADSGIVDDSDSVGSDVDSSASSAPSSLVRNENGKRGRGMTLDLTRPKCLPLGGGSGGGAATTTTTTRRTPSELPSPSTEMSRLSFTPGVDGVAVGIPEFPQLAFANPCFLSPTAPPVIGNGPTVGGGATSAGGLQLGRENPSFCKQPNKASCFNKFSKFLKKPSAQRSHANLTTRPECLRSSGVLIQPNGHTGNNTNNNHNNNNNNTLATTTEEAESPESGFQATPDEDRQSISSTSSLEIAVQ